MLLLELHHKGGDEKMGNEKMGKEKMVEVRARVPERLRRRVGALLTLEGQTMQELITKTFREYDAENGHLLR